MAALPAVGGWQDLYFKAYFEDRQGYLARTRGTADDVGALFRRASQKGEAWFQVPPSPGNPAGAESFRGSRALLIKRTPNQTVATDDAYQLPAGQFRDTFEAALKLAGLWENDVVVSGNEDVTLNSEIGQCGLVGRIVKVSWQNICVEGEGKLGLKQDIRTQTNFKVWRPMVLVDYGVYHFSRSASPNQEHHEWLSEHVLYSPEDFQPQLRSAIFGLHGHKQMLHAQPLQSFVWPLRDVYMRVSPFDPPSHPPLPVPKPRAGLRWVYDVDVLLPDPPAAAGGGGLPPLSSWPEDDYYSTDRRAVDAASLFSPDQPDMNYGPGYSGARVNKEKGWHEDYRGVRLGTRPAEFNMHLQLRMQDLLRVHEDQKHPMAMMLWPILRRLRDARAGRAGELEQPDPSAAAAGAPPRTVRMELEPIEPHPTRTCLLTELVRRCHQSGYVLNAAFTQEVRAMYTVTGRIKTSNLNNLPEEIIESIRKLDDEFLDGIADADEPSVVPFQLAAHFKSKLKFKWKKVGGVGADIAFQQYIGNFSVYRIDARVEPGTGERDVDGVREYPVETRAHCLVAAQPAGGEETFKGLQEALYAKLLSTGEGGDFNLDYHWKPVFPRRLHLDVPAAGNIPVTAVANAVQRVAGDAHATVTDDEVSVAWNKIGREGLYTYAGMQAHERMFFATSDEAQPQPPPPDGAPAQPQPPPPPPAAAAPTQYAQQPRNAAADLQTVTGAAGPRPNNRRLLPNGPATMCIQPVVDGAPPGQADTSAVRASSTGGAAPAARTVYDVDDSTWTTPTQFRASYKDPTHLDACVRSFQRNMTRAIRGYYAGKDSEVAFAALEMPIYNPFCVFSKPAVKKDNLKRTKQPTPAEKIYTKNDVRMYTTRIDAVLHVRKTPRLGEPQDPQGDTVIVEYKDWMERTVPQNPDSENIRRGVKRLVNAENMRQVTTNAAMFYLCTGILPTHVMLVSATRRDPTRTHDDHPKAHDKKASQGIAYVLVAPFDPHEPHIYKMLSWLTAATLGDEYRATYVDARYCVPADRDPKPTQMRKTEGSVKAPPGPTLNIRVNAAGSSGDCAYSGFHGTYYDSTADNGGEGHLRHHKLPRRTGGHEPIQKLLPRCEAALWIHAAALLSMRHAAWLAALAALAVPAPAAPPVLLADAPIAAAQPQTVEDISLRIPENDVYYKAVDARNGFLTGGNNQGVLRVQPWFLYNSATAAAPWTRPGPGAPLKIGVNNNNGWAAGDVDESKKFFVQHAFDDKWFNIHWGGWARTHALQRFTCLRGQEGSATPDGSMRPTYALFDELQDGVNGNLLPVELASGGQADNALAGHLRAAVRQHPLTLLWRETRPLFYNSRQNQQFGREPPLAYILGRGLRDPRSAISARLLRADPNNPAACAAGFPVPSSRDTQRPGQLEDALGRNVRSVAAILPLFRAADAPGDFRRSGAGGAGVVADRQYAGELQVHRDARANLNAAVELGAVRTVDSLANNSRWHQRVTAQDMSSASRNAEHLWGNAAPVFYANAPHQALPANQTPEDVARRTIHRLVNLRIVRSLLAAWGFPDSDLRTLTAVLHAHAAPAAQGAGPRQIGTAEEFLHNSQRGCWELDALRMPLRRTERGVTLVDRAVDDLVRAFANPSFDI